MDLTFKDCSGDLTIYALFALLSILIPVAFIRLSFKYRVELFLMKRKMFSKHNPRLARPGSHDIYISCDENDPNLMKWLRERFVPYFEGQAYRVLWPDRDFQVGVFLEDQVSELVPRCENFVVFLPKTEKDGHFLWERQALEWKHIWNHYKITKHKEVFLVNLNNIRTCECKEREVLAFLRLRYAFDFDNRNHRFLDNIRDRMGPPIFIGKPFQSSKPRFNCSMIAG
jgi:hypothetical protein